MAGNDSFERAIGRLEQGSEQAASEIYQRFARRLIGLARSRLTPSLQVELDNWGSLWSLLVRITLRKCCDRAAAYHADCRDVRREVAQGPADETPPYADQAWTRDPTPEEAAILADLLEQLMQGLGETQKLIVAQRLEGYRVREISTNVGRTERTVHRVLAQVQEALQRLIAIPQTL